jgi:hypothetical protein
MKRKQLLEEQEQSPTKKLNKRGVPASRVTFTVDSGTDSDAEEADKVDMRVDETELDENNEQEWAGVADAEGVLSILVHSAGKL